MMEATLILAIMAQQYRLTLAPGQTVTPEATLTLRPKNSIMMKIEPRPALFQQSSGPVQMAFEPVS